MGLVLDDDRNIEFAHYFYGISHLIFWCLNITAENAYRYLTMLFCSVKSCFYHMLQKAWILTQCPVLDPLNFPYFSETNVWFFFSCFWILLGWNPDLNHTWPRPRNGLAWSYSDQLIKLYVPVRHVHGKSILYSSWRLSQLSIQIPGATRHHHRETRFQPERVEIPSGAPMSFNTKLTEPKDK